MKNLFLSISKKIVVILIIFCSSFMSAQIQETRSDFWSHVRYGGGVGLNFGNEFFGVTLAPSAIYEFNSKFALGVGLNFTYNSQKDFYNAFILGGSLIALYNVIPAIQLSAEFEELNVDRNFDSGVIFRDENYWVSALYLGAAYRTGRVAFGIRYDVLHDDRDSVYAEPWAPFLRFYF